MISKSKALSALKTSLAIGTIALMASSCATLERRAKETTAAREANPGPCPRAFAIYEASRIVEFRGDAQRFANVGFTAEMEAVRSLCRYYGTSPISADLEIDMAFGRGPAASEDSHTYTYFVAVTRKNVAVIEKEYFPISVTFPPGVTEMQTTERLDGITIPRAKETTSGANFEIIVGYEMTQEQKQFNEDGKRFRVSAGAQ